MSEGGGVTNGVEGRGDPWIAGSDGRGATVLLAQADGDSLRIFGAALRHVGMRPLLTLRGEEAIRLALADPPDLVLLELRIELVDGWRVLEVLREGRSSTHPPVIALTVDARVETRDRALAAGFDDVWTKPIDPGDLIRRVREVLPA